MNDLAKQEANALPHPRGIIFDCDGTLADTMPLHWRAWQVSDRTI